MKGCFVVLGCYAWNSKNIAARHINIRLIQTFLQRDVTTQPRFRFRLPWLPHPMTVLKNSPRKAS